ncbi:MAG: hypothetical protein GY835_07010 [bacterium]|nr:hypothetical protein [bacterium]
MKNRYSFAISLLAAPWLLLSLLLTTPSYCLAAPGVGHKSLNVLESNSESLRLTFKWDGSGIHETEDGTFFNLKDCTMTGASGAPMLPRFTGLIALPHGCEAVISWQLESSRRVAGRPVPFPTIQPVRDASGVLTPLGAGESYIENPALFAEPRRIAVELREESSLRDLRVVELVVDAAAWDPEEGVTIATEISVNIRFVGSVQARSEARELSRRPEKMWDAIYAGSLLNGREGRAWRERVPARTMDRGARTLAPLRLSLETNGVYGLNGSDLIAYGISEGTPLDQIALFRRTFAWSDADEPVAEEIPVARLFVDEDGDTRLDAADEMIFVGRDLATCEDSVDPLQWYSTAGVLWVADAPDLVLPMTEESGWEDSAPSYQVPASFRRGQFQGPYQGPNGDKGHFLYAPPVAYYIDQSSDPDSETWKQNLYFNEKGSSSRPYEMTLRSPGFVPTSSAHLEIYFQGYSAMASTRYFRFELNNANGQHFLPEMELGQLEEKIYECDMDPGRLVDGESSLVISMFIPAGAAWFTLTKYWQLEYDSYFQAQNDSLLFNAGGQTGPTEIRVGGMSTEADSWFLLRTDGEHPRLIALDSPENQAGSPGNYEMRFRDQLNGDETWWLVDRSNLLSPVLSEAASVECLTDTDSYDVLVISADEFHGGMERWETFREDQGYAVKRLRASEVWDAFFHGSPGAIGLRNAARFAYQQWGVEALLLVGDSNEDARNWNTRSMPNYMPAHCMQVHAGGSYEVITLDQWVTKFTWNGWPSLVMGRLPVGSSTELTNVLDKIEVFEDYSADVEEEPGAGDWRKKFLLIADDCYRFDNDNSPTYHSSEEDFSEGILAAGNSIMENSIVGDIDVTPFLMRDLTHPYYESITPWVGSWTWSNRVDLETYFRTTLTPVAVDTVSAGYSHVIIQGHGNSHQVAHEKLFSTNRSDEDELKLHNEGQPFTFSFFGCHGNAFALFNESAAGVQDCVGEKFMLVGDMKGAVLSYASEGYEYLQPNVTLGQEFYNIMFWRDDAGIGGSEIGMVPDWRFGYLQLMAELRYADYDSVYRYLLLGDPLTRIDLAPPRVKVWVNRRRLLEGENLPALSPGAPIVIDAVVYDEVFVRDVALRSEGISLLEEPAVAGWFPNHLDGNVLDSLIANTDTLFTDMLAPLDTLATQTLGRARSWYLHAELEYDPERAAMEVTGLDNANRLGVFNLSVPRSASFFDGEGDSLISGQWIDAVGELAINIQLPVPDLPTEQFTLQIDGEVVERDLTIIDSTHYLMTAAYSWEAGEHQVEVVRDVPDGEPVPYGGIALTVDRDTRMLDALIFPNPFRDTAFLRYMLTSSMESGTLSIYTLSGRRIYRTEINDLNEGVRYNTTWDGRDMEGDKIANGVYIMRLVFRRSSGDDIVWEDKIVKMR